jgi:hypothetical protein
MRLRGLWERLGGPGVVLGVIVAVIALGGGAYAATRGGSKITACVHRSGGGLYKARRCARRDKKLSWNVVGPRGVAGPRGAAGSHGSSGATGPIGLTGNTGADGVGPGYVASAGDQMAVFIDSRTTVLSKTLPAGSYIVTATVGMLGASGSAGFVRSDCFLTDPSQSVERDFTSPLAVLGAGNFEADGTLAMQLAVTSSDSITVTLECAGLLGSAPSYVEDRAITALRTTGNS